MATEIRVGGVKYELAGTSDQGNVYVIQQSAETEVLPDIKHQETAIQTANGEVSGAVYVDCRHTTFQAKQTLNMLRIP